MDDFKCKKCGSSEIKLSKTLMGFRKAHCNTCGNNKFESLSLRREIFYGFVFCFLSLSLVIYFDALLEKGLITVDDVTSPFIVYFLLLTTGFSLIKNRLLFKLSTNTTCKNNRKYWVYVGISVATALGIWLYGFADGENENTLSIKESSIEWRVFDNAKRPVEITLFVQNLSESEFSEKVMFALKVDNDKLGQQVFNVLESINREEFDQILFAGKGSPTSEALKRYIDRGMRFADGVNYEPVEVNIKETEAIYFIIDIELASLETKKVIKLVDVPMNYRGQHGIIELVKVGF